MKFFKEHKKDVLRAIITGAVFAIVDVLIATIYCFAKVGTDFLNLNTLKNDVIMAVYSFGGGIVMYMFAVIIVRGFREIFKDIKDLSKSSK